MGKISPDKIAILLLPTLWGRYSTCEASIEFAVLGWGGAGVLCVSLRPCAFSDSRNGLYRLVYPDLPISL